MSTHVAPKQTLSTTTRTKRNTHCGDGWTQRDCRILNRGLSPRFEKNRQATEQPLVVQSTPTAVIRFRFEVEASKYVEAESG